MQSSKTKSLFFYTNSNISLAKKIAKISNLQIGKFEISKFKDLEILVFIKEKIKNKDVYVLGSTFPPSDNVLELLILINTLKVNGAKKITLIIPYFGYAKADHIDPPGSSLSAKLMVELIEIAGADKIIAIDLHSSKVKNFFKKPLLHLTAIPKLADYFKKKNLQNLAVASPNMGGVKRAKKFAEILKLDKIITIKKYRPSFDTVKITQVVGEVKNKNVIIVDDMVQSGNTIISSVKALKSLGAKNIYLAISHLVFSGPGVKLFSKNTQIKEVVFTDTISAKTKLPSKFKMLSIASDICSNMR